MGGAQRAKSERSGTPSRQGEGDKVLGENQAEGAQISMQAQQHSFLNTLLNSTGSEENETNKKLQKKLDIARRALTAGLHVPLQLGGPPQGLEEQRKYLMQVGLTAQGCGCSRIH